MVSKLDKQIISEIDSHWAPHSSGPELQPTTKLDLVNN